MIPYYFSRFPSFHNSYLPPFHLQPPYSPELPHPLPLHRFDTSKEVIFQARKLYTQKHIVEQMMRTWTYQVNERDLISQLEDCYRKDISYISSVFPNRNVTQSRTLSSHPFSVTLFPNIIGSKEKATYKKKCRGSTEYSQRILPSDDSQWVVKIGRASCRERV